MNYLRNLICFALLMLFIGSCKNDPVSQPIVAESFESKADQKKAQTAEVYKELNLSKAQIKSVEVIEKKFLRAQRKLKKEKKWAGPQNRPARAKHTNSKKKALNRVLGQELSKQYNALLESNKN